MKPLSELTDAELNEVFCIEALGWTRDSSGDETVWFDAAGKYTCGIYDVEFVQSLDAVLPFIEQQEFLIGFFGGSDWVATMRVGGNIRRIFAPTLARAACMILIEAARMKKGTT